MLSFLRRFLPSERKKRRVKVLEHEFEILLHSLSKLQIDIQNSGTKSKSGAIFTITDSGVSMWIFSVAKQALSLLKELPPVGERDITYNSLLNFLDVYRFADQLVLERGRQQTAEGLHRLLNDCVVYLSSQGETGNSTEDKKGNSK